ncbi:MAG: hypothetical protein WCD89_07910 [Anaerocolumna sp.]
MEDIQKKRAEIRYTEKFLNQSEECRNCRFYLIFRGGCNRYRTEPEAGGRKNCLCRGYQMFFEHTLGRMQDILNFHDYGFHLEAMLEH